MKTVKIQARTDFPIIGTYFYIGGGCYQMNTVTWWHWNYILATYSENLPTLEIPNTEEEIMIAALSCVNK